MSFSAPTATLCRGDRLHGFIVSSVTPLPDLRAVAYLLSHEKSGAGLLHLHNEDPENLFTIAFRTPPPDSTGLPHILEHTVLCGSKKYPVKDPFVELLKKSVATFLNAMTYPDKTVYPCASMNEKDFFNIVDVYCDAVFHPLITEKHFKQEGHHLDFVEPGNPKSPLTIKGIVYNEMKGALSDLDGIIQHKTGRSIFPDNAYGLESGGDPEAIPDLTYEQFVRFYETFYHPTNGLIFVYGKIPTEKHLVFLDQEYLSNFERLSIDTTINPQSSWREPLHETVPYPVGPNEDGANKAAVVLTFRTNNVTDAITTLSMHLLNDYLLGNAASPLRRALIDSRLGEELADSGYFAHQRDTYFCVGLKGTEADRTDTITDLVRTTCSELAERGLDRKKVEATFHRLELSSREIRPRYPLLMMDRVYRSWLYGADPIDSLRLNEHLAELRKRYEKEPGFLEGLLTEMLVDNPHYTVLTFVPDPEFMAKKEAAFRKKMEKDRSGMSPAELERIAKEAEELDAAQSAPNPPEALATLPRLAVADVPPEPFELPTYLETVADRPFLYTDVFANGIDYLKISFDLRGIDEELVDYLPVYTDALTNMGAAGLDYAAMAEREAACTGGIDAGVSTGGRADDCHFVQPFFVVTAKALASRLPDMLEVLSDRVLLCDFGDLDRLKDILLQGRIHWHSSVIPSGNQYAALHAGRHLSRNGALAERLGGITQLRMYDHLVAEIDKKPEAIVEKLSRIREFLLARGRVIISFVGEQQDRQILDGWLEGFLNEMRNGAPREEKADFTPTLESKEGIATPADVAFVAKAVPTVSSNHPDAPGLLLLSVHLSYGYLWNEVRVKRGAYGVRASYDSGNGVFSFTSYRDPCVKETLDAFQGVFQHIADEMDLSPPAIEQAIIGTLKALDQPIRPGQAVGIALSRHVRGETPEFRRRFRKRLLSLTGEDIRRTGADLLAPAFATAPVCVLSSRERLAAANKTLEAALSIDDL
jgi:Zn-dependent M16 (insulinase) family peptidase